MIPSAMQVDVLDSPVCDLGEGPVWNAEEAALYWTDIHRCRLWRRSEAGEVTGWDLPERLGCFAFRHHGRLIGAFETGIGTFRPGDATIDWIVRPYTDEPNVRFNDGKASPSGHFYSGSMDERGKEKLGALWRVAAGGDAAIVLDGIRIANSLTFSPDGRTAWFADSPERRIDVYDVDPDTGRFSNARVHLDCRDIPGVPDGSTLDRDGRLWTAFYGGGCVVCSGPDGGVEHVVELPARQPTCCAFGGRDLATLFVTTASEGLSEQELSKTPENGRLLALRPGTAGFAASVAEV